MLTLESVMTKDVVAVKEGTPIHEALNLLLRHNISGMPVVSDGMRVVGMLLEKDVLKLLFDKKLTVTSKVDDYMSREVICFAEDDGAVDVCKFFIDNNICRVAVVRGGKLVGIVSRHDIIKLIMEIKTKTPDFRT